LRPGDVMTFLLRLLLALLFAISTALPGMAASRIKDIADIEGVRDNQLVGYGLVVGLNGTGDSLRNAPFTEQALETMLERLGVNTRDANLNTRNVAAVMVTTNLPPFAMTGSRIDVTLSAFGDAKSLEGGVLLVTPLEGADGQVYAVAQGPIAIAGFSAGGDAASVTRGVPTNGRIANGALVEREARFDLSSQSSLRLSLRNPDLATASRMAEAINAFMGTRLARASSPAIVELTQDASRFPDMVAMLAEIEQLRVTPDQIARIIIDEASGVIVMGENVQVSTVAIAQGGLTVSVAEAPIASQPAPFNELGETVVLPRTEVIVEEETEGLAIVSRSIALQDLVNGLNALGVSPRDLITILQALKAAGALQAEIEVL
jgi:flagellar P-ring protein FlgI